MMSLSSTVHVLHTDIGLLLRFMLVLFATCMYKTSNVQMRKARRIQKTGKNEIIVPLSLEMTESLLSKRFCNFDKVSPNNLCQILHFSTLNFSLCCISLF